MFIIAPTVPTPSILRIRSNASSANALAFSMSASSGMEMETVILGESISGMKMKPLETPAQTLAISSAADVNKTIVLWPIDHRTAF